MMDPEKEAALIRRWTEAFNGEVLEYSRPQEVSNEEVFADVYHSLIHSHSVSNTLVQLEHANAAAIEEKCRRRDEDMRQLDIRHCSEMSQALESLPDNDDELGDGRRDEKRVNNLAAQHMEERQMMQLRWESELGHARDVQRREFREWVMCVHEQLKTNTEVGENLSGGGSVMSKSDSAFSIEATSLAPRLQVVRHFFNWNV